MFATDYELDPTLTFMDDEEEELDDVDFSEDDDLSEDDESDWDSED